MATKRQKPVAPPPVLKTASAEEWSERVVTERNVLLPSGVAVKIRILSILDLAHLGHIPLNLVGRVLHTAIALEGPMQRKGDGSVEIPWEGVSEDSIMNMLELLRKVAVVAVVEPRVAESPEDGAMDVKRIPFDDLQVIFSNAVKEGAAGLQSFRGKQA